MCLLVLLDSVLAKPSFCFRPIRKVVLSLPSNFTLLGLSVLTHPNAPQQRASSLEFLLLETRSR